MKKDKSVAYKLGEMAARGHKGRGAQGACGGERKRDGSGKGIGNVAQDAGSGRGEGECGGAREFSGIGGGTGNTAKKLKAKAGAKA